MEMIKVIKLNEAMTWLSYKFNSEISGTEQYTIGYRDAVENMKQDILEGKIPTHLFTGEEEESVIL